MIPDGTEIIDDFAFARGAMDLTSIVIPASVKSIGINPFYGSSDRAEVTVSDSNKSFEMQNGLLYDKAEKRLISCPAVKYDHVVIQEGTKSIGAYAFARMLYGDECHVSLLDSVKEIGNYAFYGDSMTCDIPVGVRRIGAYAFHRCTGLEYDLVFEGGVVIGEQAFIGTNVTGLKVIGDGGATIGDGAFITCTS